MSKMIKKYKKIYIVSLVMLIIVLTLILFFQLLDIFAPSENELPTNNIQNHENIKDINKLFSDDLELENYRNNYKNNEIVARLEIPGEFNLLLTQTTNNDYYLNYNIKKQRSDKGSEFIDYRTEVTSKQINVYGHNSRLYDLPFKKLENFLNKEYFDNNKYLLLQHDNGRRIYQIVAIKKIITDYEHMIINPQNQKEHITHLLQDSINNRNLEYDESTNIIILQTCVREEDGNYYILIGFEMPQN